MEGCRRDTVSGAEVTVSGCGPCRLCVPASQPRRHFLAGSRAEHTRAAGRAAHHALLPRTSQHLRASLRCCSVCGPPAASEARRPWKRRRPLKTIFSWATRRLTWPAATRYVTEPPVSTTSLRTAPAAAAAAADPATTLLPATLPRCHSATCRHSPRPRRDRPASAPQPFHQAHPPRCGGDWWADSYSPTFPHPSAASVT